MGSTFKDFNIEPVVFLKLWVHIAIYCNVSEFLHTNLCFTSNVLGQVESGADTCIRIYLSLHRNYVF